MFGNSHFPWDTVKTLEEDNVRVVIFLAPLLSRVAYPAARLKGAPVKEGWSTRRLGPTVVPKASDTRVRQPGSCLGKPKVKAEPQKDESVPLNFSLDFSGSPVVKTSPSNAGVQVQSLVRQLRAHISWGQNTKTLNRDNIVTNSIQTLKMI